MIHIVFVSGESESTPQLAALAGSVSASITAILIAVAAYIFFRQVYKQRKPPSPVIYKWRPYKGSVTSSQAPFVSHATRNNSSQPWRTVSVISKSPVARSTLSPFSATRRLPNSVCIHHRQGSPAGQHGRAYSRLNGDSRSSAKT